MRYSLVLLLLLNLMLLAGCGNKEAPEAAEAAPSMMIETPVENVEDEEEAVDIGGMESAIHAECYLVEADRTDTMVVSEIRDTRSALNLFTAKVSQPFPDHLWVSTHLYSKEAITDRPVVFQATLLRKIGKEALTTMGTFSGVLHNGNRQKHTDAWKADPPGGRLDVLDGLSVEPGTQIQIYAQIKLLLLSPDVDLATLDTDTITVAPEDEGVKHSNPIQITFE